MYLENEDLRVSFSLQASEWTSFYDKKRQIEYAHQSDEHWAGRNPTLFPIVGKLNQETYQLKGKSYHLGNHGFARHSEFKLSSQTQKSLTLVLTDNEETKKNYPFTFHLTNTYTLEDKSMKVVTSVFNPGKHNLPFSVGAHPAFVCPLLKGEQFSDYYLEWEKTEKPRRLLMNPIDSSFKRERVDLPASKTIPLNYDLFAQDAVVLENLHSQFVYLKGPQVGLKFSFSRCPWFGIWTKPGANFLCLEPWHGHGDFADYQGEFSEREGMISLPPGVSFEFSYQIEII